MCVCVCVCVREREGGWVGECVCAVGMSVFCVCVVMNGFVEDTKECVWRLCDMPMSNQEASL